MRMNKTLLMGLMAVVVAAVAAPAIGADDKGEPEERRQRRGEHHQAMRMEHVIEVLDLNAQQEEEWTEAHEARQATRSPDSQDGRELQERIHELAAADSPDATAIGELVIEAHQRREAARAEHEAFQAELMEILTPEQQERFEEMQLRNRSRGPRDGRGPRHRTHK